MKQNLITVSFIFQFVSLFVENRSEFFLTKEFRHGMSDFYVPKLLARNVQTEDFLEELTDAVSAISNNFLTEYNYQAFRAQENLIRDIRSATESVLNNGNSSKSLEDNLIRVNELTKIIIDCIPGNVMIKRKALPDLPDDLKEIKTHLGNEELPTIFLNLASQVDSDYDNILNIINGVYISGWKGVRLSLNKLQDKFRKVYLNGNILPVFADELHKIYELQSKIVQNVTNNTINTFLQFYSTIENAQKSIHINETL